ncbi:MAG: ABC transporter ATP-binding protein [Desulfovibrio sp.]|nr:ABC transporter ATP-binding protein [Desulfovibrio sp.]
MTQLLEIQDLNVVFQSQRKRYPALRNISFSVPQGSIVSMVGESGCGKSLTCRAIVRLLPENAYLSGSIRFAGQDLLTLSSHEMQHLRGNALSMIFQEPMTALNPVLTVGWQTAEVAFTHERCSKKTAYARALELFTAVGIPAAQERLQSYPHELSGGMRQRVMIAMALMCNPKLLLADEPTTALDATISQQILALLLDLRRQRGMTVLLISHDLDTVEAIADTCLVLYAGCLVEMAQTKELFSNPLHPYTQGLLQAQPSRSHHAKRLATIPGVVPNLCAMPKGCPFAPRCAHAQPICHQQMPPLRNLGNRKVACFL